MKTYQKFLLVIILAAALFQRVYMLPTNPPGFSWDEAAFGYDAYSILKTARDHHNDFLPLFFESFGDWKLPVFFYTLVPAIAIFGLNEFATRAPTVIFAILTILLFFFFVKKLSHNTNLSLLGTFFLAISPWHVQFSRGGFESTIGLFFVLLASFMFTKALEQKHAILFIFSFFLFTLSMYTYHAYRIFTPLFIVTLFLIFKNEIFKLKTKILPPIFFAIILSLPIFIFTFSKEGTNRASSQSAFRHEDFKKADFDFNQKSKKPLRFMSKYLFSKPTYYAYIGIKNYLDHFSPTFLFTKGDQIGRHSQVDMGQIYIFDGIFLISALFLYKGSKLNKIMITWLLLSPVPASIVTPTPHAYRTLQMVIPLTYFSAYGAYSLFNFLSKNFSKWAKYIKIALLIFCTYWLFYFQHLLFIHYPQKFSPDWQYGHRQMVESVKKHEASYQKVYISNAYNVPYIFFLFYQKYDPKKFIEESSNTKEFSKYIFVDNSQGLYDKERLLYVAPEWEEVEGRLIDSIESPSGDTVFKLWEIGRQK